MIQEQETKTQELRFIELGSDTTFKYLYKNKETRCWFNKIIKDKFNLDLDNYTLVDNELNTGNKIKDYRLDLNLKKDNNIVIIEMNNSYYQFLEAKNYQYLYRIAGKQFMEGENYQNNKTKLVLFNNFKNHENEGLKTANFIFMDPDTKLKIEDIESFEIYLPNFKEVCYDSNEVDISLSLFSCNSYEEMKEKTNNPLDLKVIKELERLAMDEKFLFEYDEEIVRKKTENSIRKESYQNGVDDGFNQGIEQGSKQKQFEIAKVMLKDKLDLEIISKYTGLTKEEINNLEK
jgi:predicted transposase/invertase (TIGR01784 family)